jgi:hypothetical protein
MSEQTQHLVERLRQRLRVTVRRITLADLAYGAVLTGGILLALWLIAAVVEAGFWLEVTPRSVLFWTLLIVAAGLSGVFLLRPLLQLGGILSPPSEAVVARRIGARYPDIDDRLVNLLDLVEGRRSEAPSPMLDGAVRMLGEPLQDVPFEHVERFERARRASRLASLPLVGLLVALLVAPGPFLDATQRLLSPGEHFQRPAPFQLSIAPGDVDLVKGASLDVTVRATGDAAPRTLTLELNHLDEDLVETVTLTVDSTSAYRHEVVNVRKPIRYRAVSDPVRTAWHTATVTERPLVRTLRVDLDFPAYTGIPSQDLAPNAGDVTALPGTQVRVEVRPGGAAVKDAQLRFDDSTTVPLALDDGRASGTFTLRREGTYQVELRTAQGLTNSAPIQYQMQLLSDAAPSVLILDPESTTDLDDALRTQLRLRLNDDFGFSRLRLYYRLSESRFSTVDSSFSTIELPLDAPSQLDQEISYDWLLTQTTDLDPVPGDVIEYYVQVWDNDTVAGYKTGRSATQRLRLPSLEERYERLDETQDDAERQMEDLLRDSDSMKEEFEQLRDELRRKQEGDWEDERQLERLQQQQQQLEERVDQLSRQMEDISRQMQENDLVSPETMEKYEELQRVADEIKTPELQDALKQLQEAMQQLDMRQMQESLQNFEFNEEQYRQRLERTLELFKKLRVQQELEEAARRAEDLAKRQEQLSEQTQHLDESTEPQQQDDAEETSQDDGSEAENQAQEERTDGETSDTDPSSDETSQSDVSDSESPDKSQEPSEAGEQSPSDEQEKLAREQERSAEEMRELEKQLDELRKQMEEIDTAPKQEMNQLQQQTQEQQLPQQMQQNAQQLRQGQMQEAQQQQQQMQQQLQQMQQQLQQMQQGMQQQQQQINLSGLRQALSDILTLSDQQETLRGTVEATAPDSPTLRQHAQRQVDLSEGLTTVSDSLQALASDIPKMSSAVQEETGKAQRAMSRSTEALSERSQRTATGLQKTSMMHLNELALLLSDLMEQMQNQQGAGGGMSMQQMMQQLQQMSGQQQQLNQQIQQMLNDMQGNRLSTDMQERLRQMAAQQDALRRQLKEMSRNRELGEKALGDLKKVAEEMEETIRELQRGHVDRPMVQRQQRILTRMLNATKSIQKRGKEEKREGTSAEDVLRQSPSELPPREQAEQLRRALLRSLENGYAPDYENLIKRYFELLQEQQAPTTDE